MTQADPNDMSPSDLSGVPSALAGSIFANTPLDPDHPAFAFGPPSGGPAPPPVPPFAARAPADVSLPILSANDQLALASQSRQDLTNPAPPPQVLAAASPALQALAESIARAAGNATAGATAGGIVPPSVPVPPPPTPPVPQPSMSTAHALAMADALQRIGLSGSGTPTGDAPIATAQSMNSGPVPNPAPMPDPATVARLQQLAAGAAGGTPTTTGPGATPTPPADDDTQAKIDQFLATQKQLSDYLKGVPAYQQMPAPPDFVPPPQRDPQQDAGTQALVAGLAGLAARAFGHGGAVGAAGAFSSAQRGTQAGEQAAADENQRNYQNTVGAANARYEQERQATEDANAARQSAIQGETAQYAADHANDLEKLKDLQSQRTDADRADLRKEVLFESKADKRLTDIAGQPASAQVGPNGMLHQFNVDAEANGSSRRVPENTPLALGPSGELMLARAAYDRANVGAIPTRLANQTLNAEASAAHTGASITHMQNQDTQGQQRIGLEAGSLELRKSSDAFRQTQQGLELSLRKANSAQQQLMAVNKAINDLETSRQKLYAPSKDERHAEMTDPTVTKIYAGDVNAKRMQLIDEQTKQLQNYNAIRDRITTAITPPAPKPGSGPNLATPSATNPTPTGAAPVHHSAFQPRDGDGHFAGPPQTDHWGNALPGAKPAPQVTTVGRAVPGGVTVPKSTAQQWPMTNGKVDTSKMDKAQFMRYYAQQMAATAGGG